MCGGCVIDALHAKVVRLLILSSKAPERRVCTGACECIVQMLQALTNICYVFSLWLCPPWCETWQGTRLNAGLCLNLCNSSSNSISKVQQSISQAWCTAEGLH
jgi:hypothetical protein